MASDMPVFPEVGSRITEPGESRPSFSAWAIMKNAARSLTEPVGFLSSSFAHSRTSAEGRQAGQSHQGRMAEGVKQVLVTHYPGPFGRKSAQPPPPATAGRTVTVSPSLTGVAARPEEADVLVVQVHVDEAPQAAVVD